MGQGIAREEARVDSSELSDQVIECALSEAFIQKELGEFGVNGELSSKEKVKSLVYWVAQCLVNIRNPYTPPAYFRG